MYNFGFCTFFEGLNALNSRMTFTFGTAFAWREVTLRLVEGGSDAVFFMLREAAFPVTFCATDNFCSVNSSFQSQLRREPIFFTFGYLYIFRESTRTVSSAARLLISSNLFFALVLTKQKHGCSERVAVPTAMLMLWCRRCVSSIGCAHMCKKLTCGCTVESTPPGNTYHILETCVKTAAQTK